MKDDSFYELHSEKVNDTANSFCLLYTSPSPRDRG